MVALEGAAPPVIIYNRRPMAKLSHFLQFIGRIFFFLIELIVNTGTTITTTVIAIRNKWRITTTTNT